MLRDHDRGVVAEVGNLHREDRIAGRADARLLMLARDGDALRLVADGRVVDDHEFIRDVARPRLGVRFPLDHLGRLPGGEDRLVHRGLRRVGDGAAGIVAVTGARGRFDRRRSGARRYRCLEQHERLPAVAAPRPRAQEAQIVVRTAHRHELSVEVRLHLAFASVVPNCMCLL